MVKEERKQGTAAEENLYRLEGRVPLRRAIPFGLQHVLAMFVANLAPVLIVSSAAVVRGQYGGTDLRRNYGTSAVRHVRGGHRHLHAAVSHWEKSGSGLPIVMGVSFTFLGSLLMICTNPELGYEGMIGAVDSGAAFLKAWWD